MSITVPFFCWLCCLISVTLSAKAPENRAVKRKKEILLTSVSFPKARVLQTFSRNASFPIRRCLFEKHYCTVVRMLLLACDQSLAPVCGNVSAVLPFRLVSQETWLTKHSFSDYTLAMEKLRECQFIKSYRIEYPPKWCGAFFSTTGFRFLYLQKFLHLLVPNDSWLTQFIPHWFISYPWTFLF